MRNRHLLFKHKVEDYDFCVLIFSYTKNSSCGDGFGSRMGGVWSSPGALFPPLYDAALQRRLPGRCRCRRSKGNSSARGPAHMSQFLSTLCPALSPLPIPLCTPRGGMSQTAAFDRHDPTPSGDDFGGISVDEISQAVNRGEARSFSSLPFVTLPLLHHRVRAPPRGLHAAQLGYTYRRPGPSSGGEGCPPRRRGTLRRVFWAVKQFVSFSKIFRKYSSFKIYFLPTPEHIILIYHLESKFS